MSVSIGVVTRTKNRPVLLRRALESVIKQSYKNWHLVVINDGGNPDEVDSLINYYLIGNENKITVLHNAFSVGMEAASNLGLKVLDTDYAVIHDDDDSWSPEFMSRMLSVIEVEKQKLPSIKGVMCYSNRVIESVNGNFVTVNHTEPFNHWIPPGLISLERMLFENMFPPISFIFSLPLCKDLGMFNDKLPVLGDWDFHIRFLLKADIWVLPEVLAFYHHRPDSDGVLGNSVISGLDKHKLYRSLLSNQWLRDDINKGGLGAFSALREHIEYYHRNFGSINSRLNDIQSSLNHVDNRISLNIFDVYARFKKLIKDRYLMLIVSKR